MTTDPKIKPTSDINGLDQTSLAAIRNLLATEPEVAPQPVAERQVAKAKAAFAPLPDPADAPAPRRVSTSPQSPHRETKAKAKSDGAQDGLVQRLKAKVLGYRPTALHIVLGCFAMMVIFRPWLVLGIMFLTGFVITGIFMILGYDGFWRRAMGLARWYARKRPERSFEMHRKLDSFAMKWDAVLDRFPEGSVDGLYLPDFGDLAAADARHDAALDRRFDSLRETGA